MVIDEKQDIRRIKHIIPTNYRVKTLKINEKHIRYRRPLRLKKPLFTIKNDRKI